jgi:hypothetical protein
LQKSLEEIVYVSHNYMYWLIRLSGPTKTALPSCTVWRIR